MEIGIMTRTFGGDTPEEALEKVAASGLRSIQLSLPTLGWSDLPGDAETASAGARRLRKALDARGIALAAVSGTFNMIHPDERVRRDGLRRLRILARAAGEFGCSLITLCTGTRDAGYMWRRHPDNDSPEAWADLLETMAEAVAIAEESGTTLLVEPEVSNVVDSARKARRLLAEIGSPRLRICIDGANLYHAGELPRMREILDEAFNLLGGDILLAHAKDVSRDGEAGHDAAGTGFLDYPHYVSLLHEAGYAGPLVLHSLSEAQVPGCIAFLRRVLG